MEPRTLTGLMHEVAESITEPQDRDAALTRLTRAAAETVPGADYASLSVRHHDGSLETLAPTSPVISRADQIQYELREGPCYDAVMNGPVIYAPDLANAPQWPRFRPQAVALGLASQMAVRLADRAGTVTGLNLNSYGLRAFDNSQGMALLFASHAALAFGFADELQGLRQALDSRGIIGQAIGLTMERYDLTDERAFEFLIRLSRASNIKLREIAADLVTEKNCESDHE